MVNKLNKLNDLYSDKRISDKEDEEADIRSNYKRDCDRIIFSSPFRRLQNKTQVFPLPGSVFVHNRLTHSLETASAGRSLGQIVGEEITKNCYHLSEDSKNFYKLDLSDVIYAGCLCHDIGNPAFGHSGEDAIADFFRKNESKYKGYFNDEEWKDLINFDGNANTLRILNRKRNNELGLTYSTVASVIKYPCCSDNIHRGNCTKKKLGIFQSEKEFVSKVLTSTGITFPNNDDNLYCRHPFAWLVEAADDICYNIIDIEDAYRLNIVSYNDYCEKLEGVIKSIDKKYQKPDGISDDSYISYLRAKSINKLIYKCSEKFISKIDDIVSFNHNMPLYDCLAKEIDTLNDIKNFSKEKIYSYNRAIEIELAGYNVMYQLLDIFIDAIITCEKYRNQHQRKIMQLFSHVKCVEDNSTNYDKVMVVIDYISGMTDNYATDLYKRINGIEIGLKI